MSKRTEIEILRQQLELLTEDSKNTYCESDPDEQSL